MNTQPEQEDVAMGQALCEQGAWLLSEMKRLRQRIQAMPPHERAQLAETQFNIDLMQMDLEMSLLDVQ